MYMLYEYCDEVGEEHTMTCIRVVIIFSDTFPNVYYF